MKDQIRVHWDRSNPQDQVLSTPIDLDIANRSSPRLNSAYGRPLPLVSNPTVTFASGAFSVSVYSETFLWPHWNGSEADRRELAILSVPAPALDTPSQPNFAYYVQKNVLDVHRYTQEMEHLAKTILVATVENQNTAFNGEGIARLVLSRFGQGAFLGSLDYSQRMIANQIFISILTAEVQKARRDGRLGMDFPIVMSVYHSDELSDDARKALSSGRIGVIQGNILMTSSSRDLIVNAWDPHSLPGNGNDSDSSLDGYLGRATGILLTQSVYFNELMQYAPVHPVTD